MDIETYLKNTPKGVVITKEFYTLGLKRKYEILMAFFEEHPNPNWRILDKIALALLQHSSKEMRKNYPVASVRKLNRTARLADANEGTSMNE